MSGSQCSICPGEQAHYAAGVLTVRTQDGGGREDVLCTICTQLILRVLKRRGDTFRARQ